MRKLIKSSLFIPKTGDVQQSCRYGTLKRSLTAHIINGQGTKPKMPHRGRDFSSLHMELLSELKTKKEWKRMVLRPGGNSGDISAWSCVVVFPVTIHGDSSEKTWLVGRWKPHKSVEILVIIPISARLV